MPRRFWQWLYLGLGVNKMVKSVSVKHSGNQGCIIA